MSYLTNYWSKKRVLRTGEVQIEACDVKLTVRVLEGALRTGILLFWMELVRKKFPMLIFGTLNLQPYAGMVQYASLKAMIVLLYGPFTHWLRRNFTLVKVKKR